MRGEETGEMCRGRLGGGSSTTLTSLRGRSNESLSKKSTSLDVTIPFRIPPSFPVSGGIK